MIAGIVVFAAAFFFPAVVVSDENGAAVPAAVVDFVGAADAAPDEELTDAGGRATAARAGDTRVVVTASGYVTVRVPLRGPLTHVTLERPLPTIGRVSVATGSAANAHQLPVATSVLDAAAIANAPAIASDRLLRELPGADFVRSNSAFTNYGQLRASFSGAGEDRGVVLADGFPAQDGFGGQIDWQAYPAQDIERIELLRGAGSALYGSGAIGGVLNLQTFAPEAGATGIEGDADLGYGSNDERNGALLLRSPIGDHIAASVATVGSRFSYADLADGYQAPDDHLAQAADAASDVRARYAAGGTTLDVAGLFASDHQDEGRENYTFDRYERQASLAATQAFGSDVLLGGGYYSRDTTIYNVDDLFPTDPGALRYIQHVPTHEDGFYATASVKPNGFEYAVRVDQRDVDGSSRQTGPTGALQAFGTGVEVLQGAALQITYQGGPFEVLAGLRGDRLRYDDLSDLTVSKGTPSTQTVPGHDEGALSPRAALRYDLTRKLALRVSGGGGFRGPYLNELVRGYYVGKIFMAPNLDLDPERSSSYAAGLDYLLGAGRLSFDAIQTHVTDAIVFATIKPTLMKRENFGGTQTESETLSYAQPVGRCSRVRLAGTTQTPEVTAGPVGTPGKQLPYVPKSSVSLGVDGQGGGAYGYSLDGGYAGQTYADSLEQQPLGAALLFGATVRATTSNGTTIELTGDNLTHQQYLTSIDRYGPPLTIALHVRVPLGASVNRDRCR